MTKRKVIFTTGIRSDYYIQNPIIKAVEQHPNLEASLIITGAHLSKEHGYTASEIYEDHHNVVAEIDNLVASDSSTARVKGAALQLSELIDVFEKEQPDFIMAPYDREESITTALAGVYMNIPVAHIGAGDRTRVNVDGIIRNSVSKLSHLIFCSTEENKQRVLKMGEEPFRVHNVGHTSQNRYDSAKPVSKAEIEAYLNLDLTDKPLIVVIQHPVSNWVEKTEEHILATLSAVDKMNYPTVIIKSNSDPGVGIISQVIDTFEFSNNKNVKIFSNVPEDFFVNIIKLASVLLGNSSMGVTESPMLKLPVVNVGMRQMDRQNAGNILFVPHEVPAIIEAVHKCLFDPDFKDKVHNLVNPYIGGAGEKIAKILSEITIDKELLNKKITY